MEKYVLVSGTNRKDAVTRIVTDIYSDILQGLNIEPKIIDLQQLPHDFVFSALYENSGKNNEFNSFREIMLAADKYVFIVPEYNGSFPGVLKAFIDGLKFPHTFTHKKCALVGISAGLQGAGIALSHLTDIFHYCGMHVLALKPKLAYIDEHMEDSLITNATYRQLLQNQAQQLINF